MGAFEGLKTFFEKSLEEIASQLNYSEENILILKGKQDELRIKFPKIYENLVSCRHNRDCRTEIQYAQDLVASWLFEDYIMQCFRDMGENITLHGKDCNRAILPGAAVSSTSDYLYEYDGKEIKIELMTDYKGYWKKQGKLDLRDDKFKKLSNEKSLLLAVSVASKTYYLIDFRKRVPAVFIASHFPYGGKPAQSINLTSFGSKIFTIQNLIDDIKHML